MRDLYFGTYLQDDWRISPKLTLNVGLRYELFTQPVDARDRGSLFDARSGKFVVPGQAGFTRAMVDGHPLNLAPRFGFAYSATQKWTIRGGTGIFFGQRSPNHRPPCSDPTRPTPLPW